MIPAAQGIDARQRQDAERLDPKGESPVANGDAPNSNSIEAAMAEREGR